MSPRERRGGRLRRGDLGPRIVVRPPGPRTRKLSGELARLEAPGVNTLAGGRPALLWEEARGSNVLDVDGNRYVDLTAGFGVAAVGHRHPEVVAAVRAQAGRLLHGLADVSAHPARVRLAARLVPRLPVDDAVLHFAVSGADAVEIALKTVILATGRPGFVCFDPAYHGTTLGALAAASRPAFRRPFRAHLHPHAHRFPYAGALEELEELIAGRDDMGAVLLEPAAGREGTLFPPPGWLRELAALCRRQGLLLVADEIFTGLGRTGSWFRVQAEDVRPDLLCCGKALGGGLPLAAVAGRRSLMAAWETGGEALHTATFMAHPLACAAGVAVLDILERDGLVERARELGEEIRRLLRDWSRRYPPLAVVRGEGLLWGLELRDAAVARSLVEACRRRGVLVLAGGPEGRVVQLAPPLVITRRQLHLALEVLAACLGQP